jgi:uncharacterized protein YecT (DUF1311 family)
VIAATALLLLAQAAVAEAADACDDPQTQLAMNMCTQADYQRADAEMNTQWEVTSAAMKTRDAKLEPGDRQPGYFETLLESQRAWLKFRDAQCLSESFMARGGSMQPMVASQCKTYLTELRTEQLRVLVAGPE